jgi:hypothetical protein
MCNHGLWCREGCEGPSVTSSTQSRGDKGPRVGQQPHRRHSGTLKDLRKRKGYTPVGSKPTKGQVQTARGSVEAGKVQAFIRRALRILVQVSQGQGRTPRAETEYGQGPVCGSIRGVENQSSGGGLERRVVAGEAEGPLEDVSAHDSFKGVTCESGREGKVKQRTRCDLVRGCEVA